MRRRTSPYPEELDGHHGGNSEEYFEMFTMSLVLMTLSFMLATIFVVDVLYDPTVFLVASIISWLAFLLSFQLFFHSLYIRRRIETLQDNQRKLKTLLERIDHQEILNKLQLAAERLERTFAVQQALQSPENYLDKGAEKKLRDAKDVVSEKKELFWSMVAAAKSIGIDFGEKISYKDFLPGGRFGKAVPEEEVA